MTIRIQNIDLFKFLLNDFKLKITVTNINNKASHIDVLVPDKISEINDVTIKIIEIFLLTIFILLKAPL